MTTRLDDDQQDDLRDQLTEAVSAAVRDADTTEDDGPLLVVDAARVASAFTESLLQEAIAAARHAGLSWAAIGAQLDVTRQAAQQRYGAPEPVVAGPRRKLLKPVTAFTEMERLAEEGRHGWHSVGFGMLYHELEASDVQWEHRREGFPLPGTRRRLEGLGWQHVGTVFPWGYYARPTGAAALPG